MSEIVRVKVLRALPREMYTLHAKASDFSFTEGHELLMFPITVCGSGEEKRAACGCDRSFAGIVSCRATTLGYVAGMTPDELWSAFTGSRMAQAWVTVAARDLFDGFMATLSEQLKDYPEMTVMRAFNEPEDRQVFPAASLPEF